MEDRRKKERKTIHQNKFKLKVKIIMMMKCMYVYGCECDFINSCDVCNNK